MICHTYKCIFVHQRKCAGSSIINTFGLRPDDANWHFMNDGALSPEYATAPSGYFRFSVIRNPWDRFISGWKYLPATRQRSLHEVLTNLPGERHDYRPLTRPQHAILYNQNGQLIVDHLIRFESLQEDFNRVCDQIGMLKRLLPHHNQGNRKHYAEYFDEDSRQIFQHHFAKDIELFGYDF